MANTTSAKKAARKIEKAVTLTGFLATAGAKAAIEAAGGSVADVPTGKVETERKTEPKTEPKTERKSK